MFGYLIFISSVSKSQNIVYADLMKLRKLNEYFCWDIKLATLIIAVYALTARKDLCYLSLGHILVFS